VTKHRVDLIAYFVLATAVLAGIATALPAEQKIALHVYLLVVGALLMTAVVSAFATALPPGRRSELTRALDTREPPPAPAPELARMERAVTLSVANAYDFHQRLLPQLREIAFARVERSGRRPGPETLGRWWDVLRPDRPEPAERFARGIPESELRALVADLERM
jgi:hypothetical protein